MFPFRLAAIDINIFLFRPPLLIHKQIAELKFVPRMWQRRLLSGKVITLITVEASFQFPRKQSFIEMQFGTKNVSSEIVLALCTFSIGEGPLFVWQPLPPFCIFTIHNYTSIISHSQRIKSRINFQITPAGFVQELRCDLLQFDPYLVGGAAGIWELIIGPSSHRTLVWMWLLTLRHVTCAPTIH